jgi:transposase
MSDATRREHRRAATLAMFLQNAQIDPKLVHQVVGGSLRTVKRSLNRFAAGSLRVRDAPRTGRPKQLDRSDLKVATDHFRRNEHATVAKATAMVNKHRAKRGAAPVCERTVRRSTVRAPGSRWTWGVTRRAKVSAANVDKRRAATTLQDVERVQRDLETYIFTDGAIVRFKKGAPIKGFRFDRGWGAAGVTRKQRLHGYKSYHFYAAVTLGPDSQLHRSRLYWVPAGKGCTSGVLIARVLRPLRAWARTLFVDSPHSWVMDGASIHTSGKTRSWMAKYSWIVAPKPKSSPDLNRIEKCWVPFKTALGAYRPRSVEAFLQRMQDVWQSLDSDAMASFIRELPDVMVRVHAHPEKLDNR